MQAEEATRNLVDIENILEPDNNREALGFAAGWLEATIKDRISVMPRKTKQHLETAIQFLRDQAGREDLEEQMTAFQQAIDRLEETK